MKVRIDKELIKQAIADLLVSWDYLGKIDGVDTFNVIFKLDSVCYTVNLTPDENKIVILDEFATVVEPVGLLSPERGDGSVFMKDPTTFSMKEFKEMIDLDKCFIVCESHEFILPYRKYAFIHEGKRMSAFEVLDEKEESSDTNTVEVCVLDPFENKVTVRRDFYREHADEIKNGTGVYSYEDGELIKM